MPKPIWPRPMNPTERRAVDMRWPPFRARGSAACSAHHSTTVRAAGASYNCRGTTGEVPPKASRADMEITTAFPIVRHPAPGARTPVLVSVPHYGTLPPPDITRDDYSEPWFETFPYGFADTFAADLYRDLHEHGATLLATPF